MEIIGNFGIGNPAGKYDLTSDPQLLRHIFKRLFPGSIPDYKNSEAVPHHVPETGGSPRREWRFFSFSRRAVVANSHFSPSRYRERISFSRSEFRLKAAVLIPVGRTSIGAATPCSAQPLLHGRGRYDYRVSTHPQMRSDTLGTSTSLLKRAAFLTSSAPL